MIAFSVLTDGQALLPNATAGTNPVMITGIDLYTSDNVFIKTISNFSGSVANDGSGIGEYCKICFTDSDSDGYTAVYIILKSGESEIAKSDPIAITKIANKPVIVEISCKFTGASKCGFSSYEIALPTTTKYREGVVRLAKTTGESQKEYTVYSARDIDDKFADIGEVVASGMVPWDKDANTDPIYGSTTVDTLHIVDDYETPLHTVTITTDSNGNLVVSNPITGSNAVASTPTMSGGVVTGSNKLVNETYISNLYANEVSAANADKLVTATAVMNYVQSELSDFEDDFVHITGNETVGGVKTFSDGVVSTSYTGTGVQSSTTNWDAQANYTKLPTVEVVSAAITAATSSITNNYQQADNDLQAQIDALNAGQNLADIVDTISQLTSHSLTDLKAKGDYKHGDSGAVWAIGDKIQVLHDTTDSSGQVVPGATGVPTVYELCKGTPSASDTKDQPSTTTGYYWHYIGEYGVDGYSKSEADSLFVTRAGLDKQDTDFDSTSGSNTNAPSTRAVAHYVEGMISSLGLDGYVKLQSSTNQAIVSPITITGATAVNEISLDKSGTTYSIKTGRSGNNFEVEGTSSQASFKLVDSNSALLWGLTFDATNDVAQIKHGSENTISFAPVVSGGSVTGYSVTGDAVADYSDASLVSATDGRLVTVDYIGGKFVKLVSATKQTIQSEIAIQTSSTPGQVANVYTFSDGIIEANTAFMLRAGTATARNMFIRMDTIPTDVNVFTLESYEKPSTSQTFVSFNILRIDHNSASGSVVADYSDPSVGMANPVDARLVTVDYLNAKTGDLSGYARLNANNTFTGTTNTFVGVSATSYTGAGVYSTWDDSKWNSSNTQLITVAMAKQAIDNAKTDILNQISTSDTVGSVGLFIYTEAGNEKAYGEVVNGTYLKAVGMSLPMSGQISYKASTTAMSGSWKLMSVAMKRTATEPCLVLAQKISDAAPSNP